MEPAFDLLFPFRVFFYGVQTPEHMAPIGQPIETPDQWPYNVNIGEEYKSAPEVASDWKANQNDSPWLYILGRATKTPPQFSVIGEPLDNIFYYCVNDLVPDLLVIFHSILPLQLALA